jgi:hypothetical protein
VDESRKHGAPNFPAPRLEDWDHIVNQSQGKKKKTDVKFDKAER